MFGRVFNSRLVQIALRVYEGEVQKLSNPKYQPEVPGDKSTLLSLTNERIANIHHRLASLHHNSLVRADGGKTSTRQIKILAENHYEKALNTLTAETHPTEFIKIHLELARLQEQAPDALSLKQVTAVWEQLLKCRFALPKTITPPSDQKLVELTSILETKIQITLRDFIKIHTGKKNQKKVDAFKKMYSVMLAKTQNQTLREKMDAMANVYETELF